ncbi:MAG: response regulator [Gemmatimonadota bacterium]
MNETRHTIVVVEDEPFVLSIVQRMLQKVGYDVVAFADPISASEYLSVDATPALLFTDVVLPGMNGFELCDVVRARFPDLPVVFTSGYPLEEMRESASIPANSRVLRKPFGCDLVRDTIRGLLEESGVSDVCRKFHVGPITHDCAQT